jgi:diguanylate cyclase (GGDEF)-like protein/PAS domain S-box-containing protein
VHPLQFVLVDILILGFLVILFAATFRARPDDRLRCWIAGWLCVLAHFAAELISPSSVLWSDVRDCVSVDALILAGLCFGLSTAILTSYRKAGVSFGLLFAASTLFCVNSAIFGLERVWLLSLLVVARQSSVVFLAARTKIVPRAVLPVLICAWLISGTGALYGIVHGQPDTVVCALLAEIYFVTAIGFWNRGWPRTVALKTVVAGLIAWATVFPAAYVVHFFWPGFVVNSEIWNLPKWCVAFGMILVVLEEDIRAARALSEEYSLLFDANPHPLWIFDAATLQLLSVNRAALDKHGYTREEFLRLKLTDILDASVTQQALRRLGSNDPAFGHVYRHIRKDGSILPLDIASYSIVFQGKDCRFVLGIDVTEREELQQQLRHQAEHDSLTGLPNRRLFEALLTEAVPSAIKTGETLAILCIDIRRFKHINNTYGPRIGDECLQRVAGMLGSRQRPTSVVARTASDEFAFLRAGFKNAAAVEQAVSELRELFAQPLLIQGYKIQLSFSMGLALCPVDGTDAVALWRGAESALRQAQTAGCGQTVWLSPEFSRAADEQIELEAYMRKQLDEGGFRLAYQPLFAFDGTVLGMEALLRLGDPVRGAVSPAQFIPIAEETGLIVPLGQWVLEEVCRQLRVWRDQGMRVVPVSVNVSGLQLMRIDYVKSVRETLERFRIDPQWVNLEVTETVAMQNLAEVAERMASLTALGISFSIDDFGTGHSSLGRLHQLPISELKIDQSFIRQLCTEDGTYSIVQAVISMAHALGLRLVAEGVETERQLDCLRVLGCDLLQGSLLSRPVSAKQIPPLVASKPSIFGHVTSTERSIPLLPAEEDADLEAFSEIV